MFVCFAFYLDFFYSRVVVQAENALKDSVFVASVSIYVSICSLSLSSSNWNGVNAVKLSMQKQVCNLQELCFSRNRCLSLNFFLLPFSHKTLFIASKSLRVWTYKNNHKLKTISIASPFCNAVCTTVHTRLVLHNSVLSLFFS